MDIPWIGGGNGPYTNKLSLGTPIYKMASKLSGNPRYHDNPTVRDACVNWVEKHGGAAYFQQENWQKELLRVYQRAAKNQDRDMRRDSVQDTQIRIYEDLCDSRQILERNLGKPVEHLCYPWGTGSSIASSLSREAGYKSNFWVTIPHRRTNRTGNSPYQIQRIKDDYIFRLPGKGRKSLGEVFTMKLYRRAKTLDIY
jgi:hypothetical protein